MVASALLDHSIDFFRGLGERGRRLAQVVEGFLQVIHVRLRKGLIIQPGDRGVDLCDRPTQVLDQGTAFLRQIIETPLPRPLDPRAPRDVARRFSRPVA